MMNEYFDEIKIALLAVKDYVHFYKNDLKSEVNGTKRSLVKEVNNSYHLKFGTQANESMYVCISDIDGDIIIDFNNYSTYPGEISSLPNTNHYYKLVETEDEHFNESLSDKFSYVSLESMLILKDIVKNLEECFDVQLSIRYYS